MNFFQDTKKLETLFEDYKIINNIEDIIVNIQKYDVYDILARISGLNLMPQNQNKSILLDGIIAHILSKKEEEYTSNYKMSSGRFKRIIEEINNSNLAAYIDPNENLFIQNIMFMDNYKVFNGVDRTPAYNLQMLIDTLFFYKNDFPEEYLRKVRKLIMMILIISDELACKINLRDIDAVYDKNEKVIMLPDSNNIKEYASYVVFDEQKLRYLLEDYCELLDDIIISFGIDSVGCLQNRPFYCRPFIRNTKENKIILLNVSLLPAFAFFQSLKIAEEFGIKNKVMNRYNEYIWHDCNKSLEVLGHYKIKKNILGIDILDKDYYKEQIVTMYNNQLMLVLFVCDDAYNYTEDTIYDKYPDERHTLIFEERIKYYYEKIKQEKIDIDKFYCMIILSSIGRGIVLRGAKIVSKSKIINLNPFELYCISINENKKRNFLPRYIKAKNKLKNYMPMSYSDLNIINFYVSNNYSFYVSDNINISETIIYISPEDYVDYINKAIKQKNTILVESYEDGYKTRIELCDKIRNIYRNLNIVKTKINGICIYFNNCIIWITSDIIKEKLDINLYISIIDALSFWLSECKNIIENMDLCDTLYHFNIVLTGDKKSYYYATTDDIDISSLIKIEGNGRHYNLIWSPKAFSQMSCKTNLKEKELCYMVLDVLNRNTFKSYNYKTEIDMIFSNQIKKKFFSSDFKATPYLKPIISKDKIMIYKEDEDHILDIIGKIILKDGKWNYGVIPDSDRTKIANEVVGILYGMLQNEIEQLSSINLVETIYFDLENTIYRLMMAKNQYVYELTCYPEKEEQYMNDYNNLNKISLALKFMMEYVAAKPPKGKDILGIEKYEYILAICSLIIDWAYKNDLFHYNIFNTPIEILKSDRIGIKKNEFLNMNYYINKYEKEQLYYISSSEFRKKYNINQSDYSIELDQAFLSDYGYTFNQFYRVINGMIDYGNKIQIDEIFVKNKDDLINYLMCLDQDLTSEIVTKIIDDISLTERENFLELPNKFRNEDVYPWRFNRAYSFNRRPLIIREKDVIWGNRQLYHMLLYLTDLIYYGKLSTKDTKMATLIGHINNERGRIFNQLVVDMFLDMGIFRIFPNVKKINKNSIADKNGNTLGDIDILIIDDKMHSIYVAEVKDFNLSRNPYEIQLEYKKMFVDDKKKCFATKHKRRVEWVREHLEDLKLQYRLDNSAVWRVKSLFIVSEPLISNQIYGKDIEVVSKSELSVEKIRSIL